LSPSLQLFLWGIAYIFPAYVANATPVVALRLLGHGHALDRRSIFPDGRRLLGDGKTLEGLVSGTGVGFLVGILISQLFPQLFRDYAEIFLMVAGALAGDIAGAFLKRRLGIPQGGAAPVLDQLGFLVGSLVAVGLFMGLPSWLDTSTLVILSLFTVLMHIGTNAFAFTLGLKNRWY